MKVWPYCKKQSHHKKPEVKGLSNYQFSMEKILDWRLDLEEEARLQLTRLQEKWRSENQELHSLVQENVKVKNDRLKTQHIESLRYNDYYKMMLDEKIVQQKNLLDMTKSDIQKAQEKLLDAHKDRKAMEKLKEKELTAVYIEEQRREQMQLDEIATMNYKRKAL